MGTRKDIKKLLLSPRKKTGKKSTLKTGDGTTLYPTKVVISGPCEITIPKHGVVRIETDSGVVVYEWPTCTIIF